MPEFRVIELRLTARLAYYPRAYATETTTSDGNEVFSRNIHQAGTVGGAPSDVHRVFRGTRWRTARLETSERLCDPLEPIETARVPSRSHQSQEPPELHLRRPKVDTESLARNHLAVSRYTPPTYLSVRRLVSCTYFSAMNFNELG